MPTDTTPARIVRPGTQAPDLQLPLLDGESFRLADRKPKLFTMLVFNRGPARTCSASCWRRWRWAGSSGTSPSASLASRGVARERVLGGAMLACAAALLCLAADGGYPLDLAAMLGAGACWQIIYVQTLSAVQLEAPPGLSGRMVGLFYTMFLGGLTLGAMAMGAIFDLAGVGVGLGAAAAGLGLYGLWCLRGAASPAVAPARPEARAANR